MDHSRENVAADQKSKKILYILLFSLPVIIFIGSFVIGPYAMTIKELLHTIYYHFADPSQIRDPNMETVLFSIRIPRVLTALLVGAALSISGAVYQGIFRNPLVSPDVLGASAGAGVGASLALLWSKSTVVVEIYAFVFCLLSVFLTMLINKIVAKDPILGLVLGGMLVSSLLSAAISYIKIVADTDDKLPAITFWLMGGFSSISQNELVAGLLPFAVGFFLLLTQKWELNVLSFGEEEARSLGVNTRRVRAQVILGTTLLIGACVSISGIIGWVGVVIPHVARAMVGPNFKRLLSASILLGASYLLLVDTCIRGIWTVEPPIGIITAILGVPFFMFILRNYTKGWSQ